MTGDEFKAIRTELRCTAEAFALALGYECKPQSLRTIIYYFETGRREIPDTVARLAMMFEIHGIPDAWNVDRHRREERAHA
jgi:hypothetical protein